MNISASNDFEFTSGKRSDGVLVVGCQTVGLTPEILKISDRINCTVPILNNSLISLFGNVLCYTAARSSASFDLKATIKKGETSASVEIVFVDIINLHSLGTLDLQSRVDPVNGWFDLVAIGLLTSPTWWVGRLSYIEIVGE